jgi:hypothetical protein
MALIINNNKCKEDFPMKLQKDVRIMGLKILFLKCQFTCDRKNHFRIYEGETGK